MEEENGISAGFSLLPQDCISQIISLTTPGDATRAMAVSSGLKLASDTDTTWERFLPLDYEKIILESETPFSFSTKRELFFHLCNSRILLNGGRKCFWLTKSCGKKCYMLCAKELSIAKRKSARFWKWPSIPESRFPEVAELITTNSLHIQCKMKTHTLSLKTNYAAYLVFKTAKYCSGLVSEFKGSVRFVPGSINNANNGDYGYDIWSVYLTPPKYKCDITDEKWRKLVLQLTSGFNPKQRMDGWMEILLGQFFNDEGDGEIEIQLYEKPNGISKSGLIIEGIEIRPIPLDA